MLNSMSSNVILAKARTRYGGSLSAEDYSALLKCKDVAEVAGYLKNHTAYSKSLAGISESDIHRGRLESILKQHLAEDYASLTKYEMEINTHFPKSLVQHDEIEYLLRAVISINSGASAEKSYFFPPYMIHGSALNLRALARVKTKDDLKKVIQHTPYEKLMMPYLEKSENRIGYAEIENALYYYFYSGVIETVRNNFSGTPRKQLLEICNTYLDLGNYVRIVRMKFQYGASAELARKALLPSGFFSSNRIDRMLNAGTEKEEQQILAQTFVGKRILKMPHAYLDELPVRMVYRLCRHYINYSIYPAVVFISYVFLSKTETSNIITIIEGKRYQLAPDEIRKLLILNDPQQSDNQTAS